ncbi:MAG: cupin [Acidimicrobiales bacterium]|jgi:quercetin dioxygenase-like cupin family protein
MAQLIAVPALLDAAGTPPKQIAEYVGLVNTGTDGISLAVMESTPGWAEPGQIAEFDEYSIVLEGELLVETLGGSFTVRAGQAVHSTAG